MKSFFAGALVGTVFGAAVVFAMMNSGPGPTSERPVTAPVTHSFEAGKRVIVEPTQPRTDGMEMRGPASTTPNNPQSAGMPQRIDAIPQPSATSREMTVASNPPSRSVNTVPSLAADPIPITEAHRAMLTTARDPSGNVLQEKHAALEQEARDETWSQYMEQMLGSYLSVRAPQAGVEIVNIVCRTTACEIQSFDNNGPNALSALLGAATRESWWEFSTMDARGSDYENRIRTIVFLGRNKKQPNEQRKLSS